jgi:hypothetical protein
MKYIYIILFIVTIQGLSCKHDDKRICSNAILRINKEAQKAKSRTDSLSLLKELEETIKEQSNCIGLYYVKGKLLMSLNYLEESKAVYYKTLIFDTTSVFPFYQLGLIYQNENSYDSSIYFLSKALRKKTFGNAMIDFNKIEGLDESNSVGRYDVSSQEIIYELAISHYYRHSLLAAFKFFSDCIDKGYMRGNSYLYRGSVYLELGKKDKACSDFNSAKQERMVYAEAYLNKYCGN